MDRKTKSTEASLIENLQEFREWAIEGFKKKEGTTVYSFEEDNRLLPFILSVYTAENGLIEELCLTADERIAIQKLTEFQIAIVHLVHANDPSLDVNEVYKIIRESNHRYLLDQQDYYYKGILYRYESSKYENRFFIRNNQ